MSLLSFKIIENIVDFDVKISLDYVLDNAEVKKYEEEVVDHETTTREVCDGCLKTFKYQITLTRHKKNVPRNELVNIDTVKTIVYECYNDAITDKCLDNTTREHIEQCDKQCLNSALFEECASLYEKLLQTGNAEMVYASFYSNIVKKMPLINSLVCYFPPFNSYVTPKLTYPTGGWGDRSCSPPQQTNNYDIAPF